MASGNPHIRYLSHAEIDKSRWDQSIKQSANALIYANSWYLDFMSPGWDALVLGNYDAVFPVTWRSKMGIRYVCQPAFTQQLGLFYTEAGLATMLPDFLKTLATRFRLIEISMNYGNEWPGQTISHYNFVLPLNGSYEIISAGYKQDLQKNLKRSAKFNIRYETSTQASAAIELYKELYGQRIGFRPQDYTFFAECVAGMMQQGKAIVRSAVSPTGELLATGIFAVDDHRIYNLASTTLPNGRMMEANHFLFDQLIQEFAGSGLLIDFEGSDQPGIARFYQKFGSSNQPYYFWKTNRLPAILRWWKR